MESSITRVGVRSRRVDNPPKGWHSLTILGHTDDSGYWIEVQLPNGERLRVEGDDGLELTLDTDGEVIEARTGLIDERRK